MDHKVVLSPSARADLREIVRFISFDSPDRALQFGLFLISQTKRLAHSPVIGRIVPELEDPIIREIIVRSYRVIYRLDDAQHLVEVIRFWHAARGEPKIDGE